jgi:YD repeat-containing protein
MISVSVIRSSRAAPSTILTNKYDAQGRITKITLAGVGAYAIEYISNRQGYSSKLKVTSPSGERFSIDIGEDDYVVRAPSVRFAAAESEK